MEDSTLRRPPLPLLVAIPLVALVLRWWQLGRYGLWTDEVYTLNVAVQPLRQVLLERDQTPPLFAVLMHYWVRLFGSGDVAVRGLPVLFGTAAIAVIHQIATRFVSARGALAVAGFSALSVPFIVLSQEARAYSLLLLLATASMLSLLRFREQGSGARAAAYVTLTTLLLYTHFYGVFFLLAQNIGLLWIAPRRWSTPTWLGMQAAILLLFAPWMPVLVEGMHRVAAGFWIDPPRFADLHRTGLALAGSRFLLIAFAGVLGWDALGRLGKNATRTATIPATLAPLAHDARWLWTWLAIPVAIPFAISFFSPIFTPRYAAPAAVPLFLLVVRALERSAKERVQAFAWIGLLTLQVVAAGAFMLFPSETADGRQDWPSAVTLIEANAAHNATLLFNKGYCDSTSNSDLACAYERYATRTDLHLTPFFFEDRGTSPPINATNVQSLGGQSRSSPDVWILYVYPSDTQRLIPLELAKLGYAVTGEWHFKRIDVMRFER